MMNNIDHIVHLMFENRSFDNTLGFLYSPNDLPKHNIPAANPTTFEGLAFGGPWSNNTSGGKAVAVHNGTGQYDGHSPNIVPTPNSGEPFDEVTEQVFGGGGSTANMSGFVTNYERRKGVNAGNVRQIMDSYATPQLKALSALARSFAVCDAWYAPVPTQTWPNRGFAHAGSSNGHLVNKPFIPWPIETIFTVLERRKISWGVYHDTLYTPPLTMIQFAKHFRLRDRFARFKHFLTRCNAPAKAPATMKLPAYTFVEPRFIAERLIKVHHSTDYHPPHNVQHAEKFLVDVYNAVRSSPYRDRILLIVTFDEHGGTYDHVPPPKGAAPPKPKPVAKNGFKFDRFGVRTPAIVVSSWVKPGTVFRAKPGTTPYDHTSVLATLRDWKQIPAKNFLPSDRIAAAPTVDAVLTETVPNGAWPEITPAWNEVEAASLTRLAARAEKEEELLLDLPPDDLEQSIVAATDYYLRFRDQPPSAVQAMAATRAAPTAKAKALPTRRAAMEALRRMMLKEE